MAKRTYKALLGSELILSDLSSALFVEVGCFDLGLQLLKLIGLSAYLLNFSLLALVSNLHASHLLCKLLLHEVEVNAWIIILEYFLIDWVERRGSKCHYATNISVIDLIIRVL